MLKTLNSKLSSTIKYLFLFLILTNSSFAFGQDKLMDNWEEELSKAKDQDRVHLIVRLSKDIATKNLTAAESLALEGIKLAKQLGDSLSMYRIGANLGGIYHTLNEIDNGLEWAQKSLDYFEEDEKLTFDKAKLQLTLASLHIRKRAYLKADSLISESESYFKKTNDLLWQSKIPATKGLLFLRNKEYEKAENYYVEALKMSQPLGDTENTAVIIGNIGLVKSLQNLYPEALEFLLEVISMDCSDLIKARIHGTIGGVYRNLEDWEHAVRHTKKSIELKKKIGLKCFLSFGLYDLGVIYKRQLNYGEGLKYLKQSLALQQKCRLSTTNTLGAIGNTHNALGEFDQANKYYDEQLELAKAENDWEGVWYVYYNKGYYAHKAKRYKESLEYLLKSLEIAEEKQKLHFLMKSNLMLTNVYDGLGKEDSSLFHAERYYLFKDSISGLQKIKKIGALEQKYQTNLQKDSLELTNQKDITKTQNTGLFNQFYIGMGMGILGLFISIYFLSYKKSNKRETVPTEVNAIDETKLDRYFKELFDRLEQNKMATKKEKNSPSKVTIAPITDMAEFLKTNLSTTNDWSAFEHYFEKVHKDFFKNIKSDYPDISINELNLCALIKLNLRSKDIAQIMGISPASVRKAQNRLSKKLQLSPSENLRDFVLSM